ncbi:type VII secretion protein EccE [Stackebrandtia albiflava]|uniref:Type VII secretion protein EccE n=1 Tax=Stackebrandtia albiflava TaxID=406432 RepID=A0A562V3Q3_9ACTN|nr:type VII secretion protein EccE [Stackebrandtia albiflava]TWJ12514.1 type VII secretion protein EccE [Stackebrandtia albiflava]
MTTPPVPSTRRRGHVGLVTLAHVIAVEVVLATLLFVPGLPLWWIGGIMFAVLVVAFGFHRGQLWLVELARWVRLRHRQRADRHAEAEKLAPGPAPHLDTINERGTSLGVAYDGTGWFAGLSVATDAPPHAVFAALTDLLRYQGNPITSVQLVTHSVATTTPPRKSSWFIVRIDVRNAVPVAADRGGGAVGVHRALSGTVGRLMKGATRIGVGMQPLDAEELRDALRFSLDGGFTTDEPVTERWGAWRHGELEQATFSWHGRPRDADTAEKFWQGTVSLPADFCAFSIAVRPASDRPNEYRQMVSCLIRLAAEADTLEDICQELSDLARKHHVRLRRCDGVQGPAAYASAISGGLW